MFSPTKRYVQINSDVWLFGHVLGSGISPAEILLILTVEFVNKSINLINLFIIKKIKVSRQFPICKVIIHRQSVFLVALFTFARLRLFFLQRA